MVISMVISMRESSVSFVHVLYDDDYDRMMNDLPNSHSDQQNLRKWFRMSSRLSGEKKKLDAYRAKWADAQVRTVMDEWFTASKVYRKELEMQKKISETLSSKVQKGALTLWRRYTNHRLDIQGAVSLFDRVSLSVMFRTWVSISSNHVKRAKKVATVLRSAQRMITLHTWQAWYAFSLDCIQSERKVATINRTRRHMSLLRRFQTWYRFKNDSLQQEAETAAAEVRIEAMRQSKIEKVALEKEAKRLQVRRQQAEATATEAVFKMEAARKAYFVACDVKETCLNLVRETGKDVLKRKAALDRASASKIAESHKCLEDWRIASAALTELEEAGKDAS